MATQLTHAFFLPFRPLAVSPLSVSGFFTSRGVEVLVSELLWIWVPCTLLTLGIHLSVRQRD